jgi:IS5 family transposase
MDGPSCDSSDDDHPTALDAEVGVVHPINLSDPGAEEALYDIHSMRAFCGLELGRDAIPDETTILNFRHLLECHDLTKAVFAAVAEHLEARGALLRGGTIVDATLIAASPSTKNRVGKRDPEMRSSKKGNQWYFGMKTHVGVDAKSGLVHTAGVTTGSVHDAKVMHRLIREDDRAVYGDKGYASAARKQAAERAGAACDRKTAWFRGSLDADYFEAYHNRGFVYEKMQKYDEAISDCDPARAIERLHVGGSFFNLNDAALANRRFHFRGDHLLAYSTATAQPITISTAPNLSHKGKLSQRLPIFSNFHPQRQNRIAGRRCNDGDRNVHRACGSQYVDSWHVVEPAMVKNDHAYLSTGPLRSRGEECRQKQLLHV